MIKRFEEKFEDGSKTEFFMDLVVIQNVQIAERDDVTAVEYYQGDNLIYTEDCKDLDAAHKLVTEWIEVRTRIPNRY